MGIFAIYHSVCMCVTCTYRKMDCMCNMHYTFWSLSGDEKSPDRLQIQVAN